MHPRVQRLDPAVEALGEAGQVLDLGDRQAEALDQRGRAAGRDQRDAGVVQAADQVLEAGLVVDGDQRAPDRDLIVACRSHWPNRTFLSVIVKPSRAIRPTVSTSIAPLGDLDPLVQGLDGVVVRDRHRGLGDDRAGVDAVVDDEERGAGDLDAVRQRVGRAVHAGERRRQRRVGVDDPAAEPRRGTPSPTSFMKPASTTRSGSCAATASAMRRSQRLAVVVVLDPVHERRDAGPLGPGQALDAVAVGADGDHRGAVRRVGAGVEQRLEVGAGAGDEHDEARGCRGGGHGPQSRRASALRPRRAVRRCHQVIASPPSRPPMPNAVTACTSTSNASGPTSRIRPGPTAPPATAARRPNAIPASTPPAQPRSAPSSQRVVGCRRWAQAAPTMPRPAPAARPATASSPGWRRRRAARPASGTSAAGRATTALGETRVPVPTVKPGPSR